MKATLTITYKNGNKVDQDIFLESFAMEPDRISFRCWKSGIVVFSTEHIESVDFGNYDKKMNRKEG